MQDNRLVLYPRDAGYVLPADCDLPAVLRQLGLAGETLHWQGELHYRAGERFLDLVSFLGCSPAINIEPTEGDGEFCHIAVASYDAPQLLAGSNTRVPRCPACKGELTGWHAWKPAPIQEHACPHCDATLRLVDLNWRRTAAVACVAVYIYGVHDSEAVPSDLLMTALSESTGQRWAYYYQQI